PKEKEKKVKEKERFSGKTYNRQELTFVSIRFATTWSKMDNKTKQKTLKKKRENQYWVNKEIKNK
ncbi:unnamed protein product, partial [Diamesa serratosioi]